MREIKYRGMSIKNKNWVYGSLLLINKKAYIYSDDNGDLEDVDFGYRFVEVDITSVGQYIGLNDKNGKEIYEWDLIECISCSEKEMLDDIFEVVYSEEYACFIMQSIKNKEKYRLSIFNDFKVIGHMKILNQKDNR